MKTAVSFSRPRASWQALPWLCGVLLLTSCATSRVNWDARVGQYHYDQVVLELGPPDKAATLGDGTKVCEWLLARGLRGGTVHSTWWYGIHHYYDPPAPDHFLRLTFAPDGTLAAWKRVAK
ncbi:MAG: hypothetical protein FJ387_06265 [Verrucomicrobia bacterium]|nr:hypothetical protein [Verrucomicrobiota bacterium]